MIAPGVYPASVTPFHLDHKVDLESLAKLLAWFESAGCRGAVLSGTNGEGPSLSATEKRDLIERGAPLKGKLELILGIATPSLEEAAWLCRRAADANARAALVMPPGYFREVSDEGIALWFERLLDRSPLPILAYNFPQRTGVTLTPELLRRFANHPNLAGVKDSSGNGANLVEFREALPQDRALFVGNETLLLDALRNGWSGTISGAANSVPHGLVAVVENWHAGDRTCAEQWFQLLLPVLEALRKAPQPAAHKAVLSRFDVLQNAAVRLPLEPCPEDEAEALLREVERFSGLTPSTPLPR